MRLCISFFGRDFVMPIDMPVAVSREPAEITAETGPARGEWTEMALTVMFTAAAVLFVSFLAVVTGLA
jgi:hypothetical protein